jgi:hypothetical protein
VLWGKPRYAAGILQRSCLAAVQVSRLRVVPIRRVQQR